MTYLVRESKIRQSSLDDDLRGRAASRRIDREHRLVYQFQKKKLEFWLVVITTNKLLSLRKILCNKTIKGDRPNF